MNYFPSSAEQIDPRDISRNGGWKGRPCLLCGAFILTTYQPLHIRFHEGQNSGEE